MELELDLDGAPDKPLTRPQAFKAIANQRGGEGQPGRHHELTEPIALKIVTALAEGNFLTTAAGVAGVSAETVYDWLKRAKGDIAEGLDTAFSRFSNAVALAREIAEANAVAALQRGGDGKFKDWRAQAWWLERRHKERWSLPKEGAGTNVQLNLPTEAVALLAEALRFATAKPVDSPPPTPLPSLATNDK